MSVHYKTLRISSFRFIIPLKLRSPSLKNWPIKSFCFINLNKVSFRFFKIGANCLARTNIASLFYIIQDYERSPLTYFIKILRRKNKKWIYLNWIIGVVCKDLSFIHREVLGAKWEKIRTKICFHMTTKHTDMSLISRSCRLSRR